MNKRSFFIVGKHAVIAALKNPQRKVLRIFLTEESKKIIAPANCWSFDLANASINNAPASVKIKINATTGRAIIFLLTATIVFVNFITDVLLAIMDPRIRKGVMGGS